MSTTCAAVTVITCPLTKAAVFPVTLPYCRYQPLLGLKQPPHHPRHRMAPATSAQLGGVSTRARTPGKSAVITCKPAIILSSSKTLVLAHRAARSA
eukprot:3026021-Pleurochrysis_carterae.AAC.10